MTIVIPQMMIGMEVARVLQLLHRDPSYLLYRSLRPDGVSNMKYLDRRLP